MMDPGIEQPIRFSTCSKSRLTKVFFFSFILQQTCLGHLHYDKYEHRALSHRSSKLGQGNGNTV